MNRVDEDKIFSICEVALHLKVSINTAKSYIKKEADLFCPFQAFPGVRGSRVLITGKGVNAFIDSRMKVNKIDE